MKGTLDKLKSRKLWVTVLGGALITIGTHMGMSQDTVEKLVALLIAYLLGQGIADHGKTAIVIMSGFLAFSMPMHAGVVLDDPKAIVLPDVPVDDPSWLERGSIWTFAWTDAANSGSGAGVRLGYELTENIRIRFDYLVESFDFDSDIIDEQSEATLSMRYEIRPGNKVHPYLIAGGGSASLASFQWEYLIGGGVDYEFANGITMFAEFLHIRTEDGDFIDRNEIRAGAGIDLSMLGNFRFRS